MPAGLVRILDRDLAAAGIPKRDDRGRTLDVHSVADDVRDAPEFDGNTSPRRTSRDAALGHQAHDGRLYRPAVARRP